MVHRLDVTRYVHAATLSKLFLRGAMLSLKWRVVKHFAARKHDSVVHDQPFSSGDDITGTSHS